MPTLPSGLLILAAALSIGACGDDGGPSDGTSGAQPGPVLPNNLSSVISLDTVAATAVLPLYRGEDMAGNSVYFIITESNKIDESVRLGLNWTPKLVHALRTKAVQQATAATGGGANPNNFPVVQFSGNVDFSPTRNLVPGPQLFPLDPSTTPGSVGDANYSPVFTLDTTGDTTTAIVYNAPHVANSTGLHDRVISIDTVGMQVTMKLVKGFYEGFPILYASTDVSDNDLAALEMGTFTPNLNETPFPGDDKPFRSAREAIIPVINGPTGVDNPSRQGLQSAILGEGDPLNIFQEQAGCANPSDPSQFCDAVLYSPLWDATPVKWTQAAIDAGIRDRITSDKREVIAPLNIIDLLADGYLEPGTPGGARNSSLGGLPAAGIIINCPIIFVEEPSR
ncbi:MAG: hypothetical protein H0W67_03815 [Gemmatimonadales bacterium]|nr:hypothetical protein [Gemmatimonadales bacterium]